MKRFKILLLVLILVCSCKSTSEAPMDPAPPPPPPPPPVEMVVDVIHQIEVSELRQVLQSGDVLLVDVRTPEEFAEGHIPGAINVNFRSESFSINIQELNKEGPIYIYCRSGYRSNLASLEMKKLGFKAIHDLKGGYQAWME